MAKSVKILTDGLVRVGAIRLPGWDPGYSPRQWLKTKGDMTQCHNKWQSSIHAETYHLAVRLSLLVVLLFLF